MSAQMAEPRLMGPGLMEMIRNHPNQCSAYLPHDTGTAYVRRLASNDRDVVLDQDLSPADLGLLCEHCGDVSARNAVYVQGEPGADVHSPIESTECCVDCAPALIRRAVAELSDHGRVVVAVVADTDVMGVAA